MNPKHSEEQPKSVDSAVLLKPISWVLPLILAAAIGLFTIDGKFVYDDEPAIRRNPVVTGEAPFMEIFFRDFWGTPIEQGISSWRPLTPMLWRVLWSIWPDNPMPFRAVSLLLHMIVTALILVSGRKVLQSEAVVLVTACLFAVHAVHAEAIGGIVSQADLLATAFGLTALNIVLGGTGIVRSILLAVALAAGCLAKESAIVFCIIVCILSFTLPERSMRERTGMAIPSFAVLSGLLFVQLLLPRDPNIFAWYNNMSLEAPSGMRIVYGLYTIGRSIAMCFIPIGLAPYHNYASVDLQMVSLLPYAIPGLAFLIMGAAMLLSSIRKRETACVVGLCLLFGPPLLQSNLIIKIMTDVTERLLYPSSIASSAMAAILLDKMICNVRLKQAAALLSIILLLGQSWIVQRPWRNFQSLSAYAIEVEPLCWRSQVSYGIALIQEKQTLPGLWHMMMGKGILTQYPGPVDIESFRKLADIPIPERFIEAPRIFDPEAPCYFAVEFLYLMKDTTPRVIEAFLPLYIERYGDCITTTLNRLGNNGPQSILDRIPR